MRFNSLRSDRRNMERRFVEASDASDAVIMVTEQDLALGREFLDTLDTIGVTIREIANGVVTAQDQVCDVRPQLKIHR